MGFSCKQENHDLGLLETRDLMGEADRQANDDHTERKAHHVDGRPGVSN